MKYLPIILLLAGCTLDSSLTYEQVQEVKKYCDARGMETRLTYFKSGTVSAAYYQDTNGARYYPRINNANDNGRS